MRWSPSKQDMYYRCGEQFRRRYIEKEVIPPNLPAWQGRAVHKGAEINETERIYYEKPAPLDVVTDATRDRFIHGVSVEGVHISPDQAKYGKRLVSSALDTTIELAKLYYRELSPSYFPVAVEQPLYGTLPGMNVSVMGILDIEAVGGRLIDMKVTKQTWNQRKADTNSGLTVYPFLMESFPTQICIENLVSAKDPKRVQIVTTRTAEDLRKWVERANYALMAIAKGVFPPTDPGNWVCDPRWCGYFFTCPYISRRAKDTHIKQGE